jgi:hypothetical protein
MTDADGSRDARSKQEPECPARFSKRAVSRIHRLSTEQNKLMVRRLVGESAMAVGMRVSGHATYDELSLILRIGLGSVKRPRALGRSCRTR